MSGVVLPQDHIPSFSDLYLKKIGAPSDFESLSFYSDFILIVNGRLLTTVLQEAILKFFEISFIPDPTMDLLCSEAFQSNPISNQSPSQSVKRQLHTKASPQTKPKRAKNYNHPLVKTRCENCKEQELRMKLIKKITTCNVADLMKFETFWNGVKIEKSQLATLPPVNEIDHKLHQELITLMENRVIDDYSYLNESSTKPIINVPDTESNASF